MGDRSDGRAERLRLSFRPRRADRWAADSMTARSFRHFPPSFRTLGLAVLGAVVLAGIGASMPATAAVPQTYIVVLDDSVANPAAAAASAGVTPTHVYRY